MKLLTLGYQGLTVARFVELLKAHGADVVADVRETPWSRKPGFSRAALAAALMNAGLAYCHVKAAGNPAENRRTAASPEECLRRFAEMVAADPGRLDPLAHVVEEQSAAGRTVCLLCYEREAADCHRSTLAAYLAARFPGLEVAHLADREDPPRLPF